jgi:hypothetical protein
VHLHDVADGTLHFGAAEMFIIVFVHSPIPLCFARVHILSHFGAKGKCDNDRTDHRGQEIKPLSAAH